MELGLLAKVKRHHLSMRSLQRSSVIDRPNDPEYGYTNPAWVFNRDQVSLLFNNIICVNKIIIY